MGIEGDDIARRCCWRHPWRAAQHELHSKAALGEGRRRIHRTGQVVGDDGEPHRAGCAAILRA